jgi:hypothetical protein
VLKFVAAANAMLFPSPRSRLMLLPIELATMTSCLPSTSKSICHRCTGATPTENTLGMPNPPLPLPGSMVTELLPRLATTTSRLPSPV